MSLIDAMDKSAAEVTDSKRVMRVMDPVAGDLKVVWDPENSDEVDHAQKTFDEMREKGFTAYSVDRKGEQAEVVTKFDPDAEALILAPAVVGG